MTKNDVGKYIASLSTSDENRQILTALIKYFPPNDMTAVIQFLKEQPSRVEKLCAIMTKKFAAIRKENVAALDKALAEELALLMQADE